MAYADALRSATPTMEDVADLIDDALPTIYRVNASGLSSTTATSATTLTSMTDSVTVASGQRMMVWYAFNYSIQTAGDRFKVQIYVDGVGFTGGTHDIGREGTETGTLGEMLVCSGCFNPQSIGTGTYDVEIRAYRTSGSGALYFADRELMIWIGQGNV